MTTPVLEERGLVVPDGLFEIPDASPSGADFQIPSQFDNPRGQFHGTSTFGRSAREDAFSYLRSIGGGGAGGWEVACGGAARWCASGPGPERYELGGEGDGSFGTAPPVCAEFRAPMRKTTKGRTAEETVRELTERTWGGATMGAVVACSVRAQEQYVMPRALDACYGSQFARADEDAHVRQPRRADDERRRPPPAPRARDGRVRGRGGDARGGARAREELRHGHGALLAHGALEGRRGVPGGGSRSRRSRWRRGERREREQQRAGDAGGSDASGGAAAPAHASSHGSMGSHREVGTSFGEVVR